MEDQDKSIAKIGNEIMAVVAYGKELKTIQISKKQLAFLSAFMRGGDLAAGANAAGVEISTAKGWMRNRKFKAYVLQRLDHAAKVHGFDLYSWGAKLIEVFNGVSKTNKNQLRAAEILGKAFGFLKERTLNEHISLSRKEIVFVQGDDALESNLAQRTEISAELSREIPVSHVRATMGQEQADVFSVPAPPGNTQFGSLDTSSP